MAKPLSEIIINNLFDEEPKDDSCCGGDHHGGSDNINQDKWGKNDYNNVIIMNHKRLASNKI